MIRDPSDGTIRLDVETPSKSAVTPEKPIYGNTLIATSTSGLQSTSSKSDYLARLEMSREWLRKYRKLATTTTE